jgi:uncharacterized protein
MRLSSQKWLKTRMKPALVDQEAVLSATRQWLERAVIGLNLCPFAKAVHVKQQIRWVVSDVGDEAALLEILRTELALLHDTDPQTVDTTLLIHPHALQDFFAYNDFLSMADALLQEMALEGVLQIASFHPQYQFAGTAADDVTNNTNRSPYPMLHLLREDSVARAVAATPDAADIYTRNMHTLRRLGQAGWLALFAVDTNPSAHR